MGLVVGAGAGAGSGVPASPGPAPPGVAFGGSAMAAVPRFGDLCRRSCSRWRAAILAVHVDGKPPRAVPLSCPHSRAHHLTRTRRQFRNQRHDQRHRIRALVTAGSGSMRDCGNSTPADGEEGTEHQHSIAVRRRCAPPGRRRPRPAAWLITDISRAARRSAACSRRGRRASRNQASISVASVP
jgi:hypothetical protein